MDRKLARIPIRPTRGTAACNLGVCEQSLCQALLLHTRSQGLQHHKKRLKVKNANYFLKIEKMSWDRGRRRVLTDGLAVGEEALHGS